MFQQGKSYVWLFPVFLGLFFGGCWLSSELFQNPSWGILTLPAFVAFLLAWEIRSGVALDPWWRATYRKGSWQYRAMLWWHAVAVVLMSAFSFFFVQ